MSDITMKDVEYHRKRLIYMAKKYAAGKECPRCHAKKHDWKVVPLFEYGDPFLPSQVVLYCNSCKKYNETFAKAPDKMSRAYAEEEMRLKKAGIKLAKPGDVDKLIIKR